jgi:hypothetical protein
MLNKIIGNGAHVVGRARGESKRERESHVEWLCSRLPVIRSTVQAQWLTGYFQRRRRRVFPNDSCTFGASRRCFRNWPDARCLHLCLAATAIRRRNCWTRMWPQFYGLVLISWNCYIRFKSHTLSDHCTKVLIIFNKLQLLRLSLVWRFSWLLFAGEFIFCFKTILNKI